MRAGGAPIGRMSGAVASFSGGALGSESMRKPTIGFVFLSALIGAGLFGESLFRETSLPSVISRVATAAAPDLPSDAVVVNASKALTVRDPFRRREDASAVEGTAMVLPEKAGGHGKGLAEFDLKIPRDGTYVAWVRARWRDSCGNSLRMMVDGGRGALLGEDHVYGAWHWVRAGGPRPETFVLRSGAHKVMLLEREDGIAFDQVLFTTDARYTPSAPLGVDSMTPPVRIFADDFSRSPGHGMEAWDLDEENWKIAFSFDPNRVPNEYGLVGRATNGETTALLKGGPWHGCRLEFSFSPLEPGAYGALLDAGGGNASPVAIGIGVSGDAAALHISGAGLDREIPLGERVRLKQWHRIVVERWAWILRVFIDDVRVFASADAVPGAGLPGFFVRSGSAVFDDMHVQNVAYQADDGGAFTAPWTTADGAKWLRPTEDNATEALIGHKGTMTLASLNLPVEEIILEETPGCEGKCRAVETGAAGAVSLHADDGPARVRRIAVRYRQRVPDTYARGPYRFDRNTVEDASDYMDFTPEEYERIQKGPEAHVTRRVAHVVPMLSRRPAQSPWQILRGSWRLRGGALVGSGKGALLRHTQPFNALLDVNMVVRLAGAGSEAEISLYAGPETGLCVRIGSDKQGTERNDAGVLNALAPADGKWHELHICVREKKAYAQVDKGDWAQCLFTRGDGGEALFKISSGHVEFNEIEFRVPERYARDRYYAFDRREPDWWREGGDWIDHDGISCAIASNWIGLVAPRGEGMLWNKRAVGPDALLAFNVFENSEWFGWHRGGDSTHRHYPYDNIVAVLGTGKDVESGYRFEFNSRNRTAAVLYRNGKEVVVRVQDGTFPIRYQGGHSPTYPRRSRITLVKRGNLVRAIVNGVEVLRYEDKNPLDVAVVGVGGYRTRANFSMIEVRTLRPDKEF